MFRNIVLVLTFVCTMAAFSAVAADCRIMAAGDQSVFEVAGTQPNPSHGMVGIRLPIQKSLADLGLACDWVGDTAIGHNDGPSDGIIFDPDMVGGGTIFADDLGEIIGAQVVKHRPHIVIVGAGVYDPLSQMVPNGPNMTLQPPWLAALDVVRIVDVIRETDPAALIALMVPVTGINHYAPLEDLRTNILSLMITRTFADIVDVGRLVVSPDDYVALELLTEGGQEKAAKALLHVIVPTIEGLQPAPVPLPSAVILFGFALMGLGLVARRRQLA